MVLTPKGKKRLASPLIIKPLAFSKNNGVGLLLKLNHPRIDELELEISEKTEKKSHRHEVGKLISKRPILAQDIYKRLNYDRNPLRSYTDAIDAFLSSKEVSQWKNN
ncbi:hypothetical protein D3C77_687820 [compost metagenome]